MFNKKPEFHLRRQAGQMITENDPYMGVGGIHHCPWFESCG